MTYADVVIWADAMEHLQFSLLKWPDSITNPADTSDYVSRPVFRNWRWCETYTRDIVLSCGGNMPSITRQMFNAYKDDVMYARNPVYTCRRQDH